MKRIGLLSSIAAILILGFAYGIFAQQTAVDPVCGMTVSLSPTLNARLGNQTYYFCSEHCLDLFAAGPQKYLDSKPAKARITQATASMINDPHPGTKKLPAGCGGCPAAAGCLGKVKTDPGCGANCGKTRITEVNNFHNIMHPIHLAGQRGDIQKVRETAVDMSPICQTLKVATLPDGIDAKQFQKAQKALQKSVDKLIKSCKKDNDEHVLADLNVVHEKYVALQSLVQQDTP